MIIKNFFLVISSAALFQNSNCINKNLEFIDAEKFISGFNSNRTDIDSVEFELRFISFLDLKFYNYLDSLSSYNKNISRYLHANVSYTISKDTVSFISLSTSIKTINEVICKPERNLKKSLKEKLGIEYEEEIFKKILIYKNKAFVLFTYDIGQTALIFDLKTNHSLDIVLVYTVIE